MDKAKYRKENGNFVRRVGPLELESYVLHVIDKDGLMQRIINPPEDVIGILLDEDEVDVVNPKVEFVYSIKKMARKHGKPKGRSSKSSGKFGLNEFAELFADAEKPLPRRGFPMMSQASLAELQLPDGLKVDLDKAMEDLLEQEARKRWDEWSKDLCSCKKKRIIEQIKQEHEQSELQRLIMQAMIMGHDSYGNMLLDQLDRSNLVLALNLGGEKRGIWTLEKKNPRLVGAKLLSGKKEYWRN